jgi:hypothetical protein
MNSKLSNLRYGKFGVPGGSRTWSATNANHGEIVIFEKPIATARERQTAEAEAALVGALWAFAPDSSGNLSGTAISRGKEEWYGRVTIPRKTAATYTLGQILDTAQRDAEDMEWLQQCALMGEVAQLIKNVTTPNSGWQIRHIMHALHATHAGTYAKARTTGCRGDVNENGRLYLTDCWKAALYPIWRMVQDLSIIIVGPGMTDSSKTVAVKLSLLQRPNARRQYRYTMVMAGAAVFLETTPWRDIVARMQKATGVVGQESQEVCAWLDIAVPQGPVGLTEDPQIIDRAIALEEDPLETPNAELITARMVEEYDEDAIQAPLPHTHVRGGR